MKLNVEEAENLLSMLNSSDNDNKYLALKVIDAHDFSGVDFGYLIYLYKFSKTPLDIWKENAEKAYQIILDSTNNSQSVLTNARGLTILIEKKADQKIIDMYLRRHTKDLKEMLYMMGYPMDHVDLTINIKQ